MVAAGVLMVLRGLMEGGSGEDQGEGVLFCVYVYNVQPGIAIDLRTGESGRTVWGSAGSTADREGLVMAAAEFNRWIGRVVRE